MIRALLIRVLLTALIVALSLSTHAMDQPKADRVLVKKSERKLILFKNGEAIRDYDIALGENPKGHKRYEGDERTPEGTYILDWRNPNSKFYRSIHISYPNSYDQQRAAEEGRDPGGMIMIHGRPSTNQNAYNRWLLDRMDWTDGCIAVKNTEMDEIWAAVDDGTPIEIHP